MAAKIVFTLKFILVWIASYGITPLAKAVDQVSPDKPHEAVFYFLLGVMFIPEAALSISKGFREWIKRGVEDGDGVLHGKDINNLIVYWASLTSLRFYGVGSLVTIFYGDTMHVPFHLLLLSFIGSLGLAGFGILKTVMQKTKIL